MCSQAAILASRRGLASAIALTTTAFLLSSLSWYLSLRLLNHYSRKRGWYHTKTRLLQLICSAVGLWLVLWTPYLVFLGSEYLLSFGAGHFTTATRRIDSPAPLFPVDCRSQEMCEGVVDVACKIDRMVVWTLEVVHGERSILSDSPRSGGLRWEVVPLVIWNVWAGVMLVGALAYRRILGREAQERSGGLGL